MEGATTKTSDHLLHSDTIRTGNYVPKPLRYNKRLAEHQSVFPWSEYHLSTCHDSQCSCKPHPCKPDINIKPVETMDPRLSHELTLNQNGSGSKSSPRPQPVHFSVDGGIQSEDMRSRQKRNVREMVTHYQEILHRPPSPPSHSPPPSSPTPPSLTPSLSSSTDEDAETSLWMEEFLNI